MFRKTGVVLAVAGVCALSLFLLNCGTSSSRSSGLLYVLSQEQNAVSSYAIDLGSGNLSLINSNAKTDAMPLQISLDPTGATAFVLNQGSITGYTVNSDGSLTANSSAVVSFATGEVAVAMTRDAAGDLLFVITNLPAIYVYSTKPGSTTVNLVSTISSASTPPLNRLPSSLSAITYTPNPGSAQTVLFVTFNVDLGQPPNDNTLSVYAANSSGAWVEQPNSPYTTQVNPTVVQALNTTPLGTTTGGVFVYVGNSPTSGAGGVTGYQVCTVVNGTTCQAADVTNHTLLPLGSTSSVGQHPLATLVDPTNSFLYVGCHDTGQVFAFSVGTLSGKLTALSPASVQAGAPVALAMHPGSSSNNEFLYVSNNSNVVSSISGFPVAATTGVLGSGITIQFTPGQPTGIAGK